MQGKSDATADVSVSGNLTVAKTLYVKSIEVASGGAAGISRAAASSSPSGGAIAGTSATIGGAPLEAGQCTSGVARLSGVASSMVATASPISDPGDGFIWQAFVSGANTVTVKVCAISRGTPRPVAYNIRVQ